MVQFRARNNATLPQNILRTASAEVILAQQQTKVMAVFDFVTTEPRVSSGCRADDREKAYVGII